MGMFDYCNLTIHDENGTVFFHRTGQVSIEKMLATYNITEHGFFIKFMRRFRNRTIYMSVDHEYLVEDYPTTPCTDIWITFNRFGVITKLEYMVYALGQRDKAIRNTVNISPVLIRKWSIDNIKSDLMFNPQLFKGNTSYFKRMYYFAMFNYYELKDLILNWIKKGKK